MAIRVLILHRQLVFAVTVRQALEQTGRFDAHPFTQADAAFDYLRDHPQDVALVDFTLPGRSGPKIVQQLRAIQPDLAIIITPHQENGDVLLASLNLQGMIDTPFGAREIIPLLEEAVNQIAQTPPQGAPPYEYQSGPLTDILGTSRLTRPQIELGPLSTRPLPPDMDDTSNTEQFSRPVDAPVGAVPPTRPLPTDEGGLSADLITKLFADMDGLEVNQDPPATGPFMDTGSTEVPVPSSATDILLQDVMDASLRQYPTGDLLGNPFTDDDYPTTTYEDDPAADIFDQLVTGLLPDEQTGKLTSNPTRILGPDDIADEVYLNTAELNARRYGPTDKLTTGPVGPERSRKDEASELRRAFETGTLVEPPRRRTGSIPGTPPPARLPEEEAAELRRAFETGPLAGNTDHLSQPESEMDWLEQIIPGTRDLPPEDPLDSLVTRDLQPGEEPPRRRGTTPYREAPPPPPSARSTETEPLPAFNSLDNVVQNFGFDAPLQAEDTPAVPMPPPTETSQQPRQRPERDFNNLVDSMRPGETRSRLPERQQQVRDFMVTGGMDSVLQEIKKTRTSQLPRVTDPEAMPPSLPEEPRRIDDTAAFKRLAAEEPPLPSFEASGTVRDLMVGVSDPAFQNVLSLIQGDAVADTSQMQAVVPSATDDINAAFDSFAEPPVLTPEPTLRPALRLMEDYNFGFDDDESGGTSIAQAVLEGSARFSDRPVTSGDVVDQLMQDIQNRLSFYALAVKPLPSWGMETGAFRPVGIDAIREPDFLPEQFEDTGRTRVSSGLRVEPPTGIEFSKPVFEEVIPAAATIPSAVDQIDWDQAWDAPAPNPAPVYDLPEIEARDEDSVLTPAEVDQLPPSVLDINWDVHPEAPPAFAPEVEAPAPMVDAWDAPPTFVPEMEAAAPAPVMESWEVPASSGVLEFPEPEADEAAPEDSFLATVALNLTQYSLETNACSTILTRGHDVLAFAGDLTPYDVEALTAEINADWDVSVEGGARIRFVNLQHTGRDYMLYSIRTEGDLILSLLYDSEVSIRAIRQQAGKLVTALKSTPAPAPKPAKPVSLGTQRMKPVKPAAETYNTYAYLWLLRDPDGELERPVQQAVRAGLTTQLSELFWEIKSLDVHEDYIYLLANVPGEASTHDLMRDLQHRSAQIARAQNPAIQPDELWADGYLALAPGRALQTDEIQGFINFQRMA
jgi:DNA-binding NarL/FixJ family response regulator/REP element-mobilizing transposase RayT/CBS domain-containing protein